MYKRQGKWRTEKNGVTPAVKRSIVIDRLRNNDQIIQKLSTNLLNKDIATENGVHPSLVSTTIINFFKNNMEKSWLPEPLKTRYSHCKSWSEAKELKKEYDEQDRQAAYDYTIQDTDPL